MYSLGPRGGRPGVAEPKPRSWLATRWLPASRELYSAAAAAAAGGATAGRPLAGPDWSHANMPARALEGWLAGVGCHVGLVTVHLYGGDPFRDRDVRDVLKESRVVSSRANMRERMPRGHPLVAGFPPLFLAARSSPATEAPAPAHPPTHPANTRTKSSPPQHSRRARSPTCRRSSRRPAGGRCASPRRRRCLVRECSRLLALSFCLFLASYSPALYAAAPRHPLMY